MSVDVSPEFFEHSSADDSLERIVFSKVALRLVPFLFLLYVVNILDRVNVGFARLSMLKDLGLSEGVFSFGAGVFYLGYMLFEVPSNLILHRMGARRWISRIMVSWGIVSACMMFVRNEWSFYLLRVLLGVAEAGFFPGIILYISYWFPARERARVVAIFMMGSPFSGIIGYPLSGALLQYTNGLAGLAGWQWLFLIEGIPAVVLGLITWQYLTDRPDDARWLTPTEREWLAKRMARDEQNREQRHGLSRLRAMGDRRVWLMIAIYFTLAMGTNALGFFLPKILEGHFSGASKLRLGLLSALPHLAAVIAMFFVGTHSDRGGERRWHVALPAFVATTGWCLSAYLRSPTLALISLAVAQAGMMSMMGPFWSLATSFLSGAGAAGGIALINTLANIGGFFSPIVMGQLKTSTGSFTAGELTMAVTLAMGGLLALSVRHDPSADSA